MTPEPGLHHCSGISMEDTCLLTMRCPVYRQCHQDKAFLKRSLNIQNGFGSMIELPYQVEVKSGGKYVRTTTFYNRHDRGIPATLIMK